MTAIWNMRNLNNEYYGYEQDPAIDFFNDIICEDSASLQKFWAQNIAGKPLVWTIVGDKKQFDIEALSKYGDIVGMKPKDIIK